MKKNTKVTFSRSFSILAAAALSMTLIGGQTFPAYAENSSGIESGAVIPDNITIDSPTALANIALPSNAYGTLSWADSSYVPDKRVQSCGVVFKPAAGADLSGLPGWDSNSGTLTGSVTVVSAALTVQRKIPEVRKAPILLIQIQENPMEPMIKRKMEPTSMRVMQILL